MECADLERYLEAVLDNRLGRNRLAFLKRHLAGCPACRARVDRLRQFERDLQRRLRADERSRSLWGVLDSDLVRSAPIGLPGAPPFLRLLPAPTGAPSRAPAREPAPPALPKPQAAEAPAPRHRPRARVVGLVLILTAVGSVAPWMFLQVDRTRSDERGAGIDRADLAAVDRLPLRTHDPAVLEGWLRAQTGIAFPVPRAGSGFELTGARIGHAGGTPNAMIGYRRGDEAAVLYLRPDATGDDAPPIAQASGEGLSTVRWSRQGFDMALLTPLPPEQAAELGMVAATP